MKVLYVFIISMALIVPMVSADQVNMNITVNGTSNLNINIDADDTLARQMINQTNENLDSLASQVDDIESESVQRDNEINNNSITRDNQLLSEMSNLSNDAYGTTTGSGPRDMVLEEIMVGHGNPIYTTEGVENMSQLCSDPFLSRYLNSIGGLPPSEFVNYLKGLGYDDESHVNFIWTICQQEYINYNQDTWSTDTGMLLSDFLSVLGDALSWLKTGSGMTLYSKDIALMLSSYFASNNDVDILVNKINQQDLRIQALERTMEQVAPAAYCQGKLDLMKEYNLSGVKCGTNSTMYWNAEKASFENYDVISYTDCTEDWRCSGWSSCSDGLQIRTCEDSKKCGSFTMMPETSRECTLDSIPEKDYSNNDRTDFAEYIVSSISSFFLIS